jgi:hypothetical protein
VNKQLLIGLGIGFVVGAGAATAAVIFWKDKNREAEIDAEIEQVKLDYARVYSTLDAHKTESILDMPSGDFDGDKLVSAKKLAKQAKADQDEIMHEMNYTGPEEPLEPESGSAFPNAVEVNEDHNVFSDNVATTRQEDRTPDKPYVISVEEFMDDEPVYDKITLTYFEEDDTLIEEKDESVIDNADEVVGDHNLLKFGYDPRDKDAIHVRNERLECDFEVTRDERSYVEVILGVKDSDKIKRGPGKFKADD